MSHQELFEQFRSIRGVARQNDLPSKEMTAWIEWVRGVYQQDALLAILQAIADLRADLDDKLHALAVQLRLTHEAIDRQASEQASHATETPERSEQP